MIRSGSCSWMMIAGLAAVVARAPVVRAEPASAAAMKEAGSHFERGVTLYTEADYRAALVEFRRAYELAPNASVLYNIGQTYYQLQNYAAALITLQRYLNEAGAAAQHRKEVEPTIATLQARVGKLAITANLADSEILVDDVAVGKTPLAEPVIVSVGSRKITVNHAGRPSEIRQIDVAAGDTVQVPIAFAEPAVTPVPSPATAAASAAASPNVVRSAPPPAAANGHALLTAGWITTGVLGATAITTGVIAIVSAHQLSDDRNSFPVRKKDLDDEGARVKVFSAIADVSGVLAVIAGGLTLKLQLSHAHDHEAHLAVAPGGLQVAGSFR